MRIYLIEFRGLAIYEVELEVPYIGLCTVTIYLGRREKRWMVCSYLLTEPMDGKSEQAIPPESPRKVPSAARSIWATAYQGARSKRRK